MVKYSDRLLDETFGALADPTRRAILAQLAQGETSVTTLAARFDISLPGVTKHLQVLERAHLLSTEKTGRVRRCRLEPARLRNAAKWIAYYRGFWEQQLDSLAHYFDEINTMEKEKRQAHTPPSGSRSTSHPRLPLHPTGSSTRGGSTKS